MSQCRRLEIYHHSQFHTNFVVCPTPTPWSTTMGIRVEFHESSVLQPSPSIQSIALARHRRVIRNILFTPQWICVLIGSNECNSRIPISFYLSSFTTPAIDICTNVTVVSLFLHWCCDAYQHVIEYWLIELTWAHTVDSDLLKLFIRVSTILKFFGVQFAFATGWEFSSWASGEMRGARLGGASIAHLSRCPNGTGAFAGVRSAGARSAGREVNMYPPFVSMVLFLRLLCLTNTH